MSDMGEIYAALKEESKERRANHRKYSPELLKGAGILFESKNAGGHLIVKGAGGLIDFWPGTGKWIARSGEKGRGVRKLMRYISDGG